MRISDWSSDVCSSDLGFLFRIATHAGLDPSEPGFHRIIERTAALETGAVHILQILQQLRLHCGVLLGFAGVVITRQHLEISAYATFRAEQPVDRWLDRSEEHTSELQSLMRISYAVFCLKKKKHELLQQ